MCGKVIVKSGAIVIDIILKEILDVIRILSRGENLIVFASTAGIMFAGGRWIIKKVNHNQDALIESLGKRLDEIDKEQLRNQILTGIHSKRFSKSELLYFFDKYKAKNGNSFVEEKVRKYLSELDEEEEENDGISD